jgi:hypothetical protein
VTTPTPPVEAPADVPAEDGERAKASSASSPPVDKSADTADSGEKTERTSGTQRPAPAAPQKSHSSTQSPSSSSACLLPPSSQAVAPLVDTHPTTKTYFDEDSEDDVYTSASLQPCPSSSPSLPPSTPRELSPRLMTLVDSPSLSPPRQSSLQPPAVRRTAGAKHTSGSNRNPWLNEPRGSEAAVDDRRVASTSKTASTTTTTTQPAKRERATASSSPSSQRRDGERRFLLV